MNDVTDNTDSKSLGEIEVGGRRQTIRAFGGKSGIPRFDQETYVESLKESVIVE